MGAGARARKREGVMKAEKYFDRYDVFPKGKITTNEELDRVYARIQDRAKDEYLNAQTVDDPLGAAKGFVWGVVMTMALAGVLWLAAWWWFGGLAGAVK